MWLKNHSLLLTIYKLFAFILFFTVSHVHGQGSDSKIKQWETEGDTLMAQERFVEAARYFTRVIDVTQLKEKAHFNTLYKRAICYYYIEEEQERALADVSRFLTEFPLVPQAHILRALIYRNLDDPENQLNDLNVALNMQAPNPGLLVWRAGLLIDKEQYELAKADAQAAIALQDNPEAQSYLAFAYFNTDHPDSALMAINRAIDLDYTYVPAYLYGGSFCIQSGEYDLALQYLNLGLRVDAEHEALYFYKGVALVEADKIDAGCSCLNKAFYLGYEDAAGYIEEYCYKTEEP